jgi:hypothetical protein
MIPVKVECYSGYKGGEKPRKIIIEGIRYRILNILTQWREPENEYFQVVCENNQKHLLCHHLITNDWFIVD